MMEPRLLLSAAAHKTPPHHSTPVTPTIKQPLTKSSASAHLFLIEKSGPFASPTLDPLIGGNAPFSPTDVRNYYGINNITFGTSAGTGAGQTIAIVDAYSQPDLLATTSAAFNTSDLHVFDNEFNLPDPPSFIKLDENGGTNLPTTYNSGWALETSLDVEWAHAVAPQASIVLVEAASSNFGDLLQAVSIARSYPGVVAVSMSWGDTENDIEAQNGGTLSALLATENSYNANFTTPAGHVPITFVASTGDSGASATVFPSLSPSVLAIGGTSIVASDFSADYGSETVWNDQYGATGGNVSIAQPKPGFQFTVTNSNTNRTVPDVSFDADPATGVYVLDTSQSKPGYYQVGGTSLGSPAWAALIAIADQGRSLIGLPSLNGATQTLPRIYQLSTTDFHDITSGNNFGFSAAPGYDLATGIGTPIANLLIPDLAGGATISGQLFQDNNANGIHDGLDSPLANKAVFLDLNNNGIFDANDPTATTNASGNYTFTDQVGTANASVLLASPAGFIATVSPKFTASFNSTIAENVGYFPTIYPDSTASDKYVLQISPTNSSQLQILVNNVVTYTAPLTLPPSLTFNLSGASDTLTVDALNGNPIPLGSITDNGAALTVLGSVGNDSITFNTNSVSLGTGLINLSAVPSLTVDPRGGTDTLTVNAGAVTIPAAIPNGGILVRQFASLSVAAGASLALSSPTLHTDRTVLVAANLSVNPTGKLDLGSNDLIVHNGNLVSLTALLATGFAAGAWTGSGLASSAAHNDSTHMTAIGMLLNGVGNAQFYTAFDGVAVSKTDVLIKFTYYGDANLSGNVDGDDYDLIDNGYNTQLTGWQNGDFNYSGAIDATDYTMLDNADNSVIPML